MIRYGIPWYLVNPAPEEWNFSWTDEVPGRLSSLGLTPIPHHDRIPSRWRESKYIGWREGLKELIRAFHVRYEMPIFLTETSMSVPRTQAHLRMRRDLGSAADGSEACLCTPSSWYR